MQALLMNLTQTTSAPLAPKAPIMSSAEAESGKETTAFGDLLQAMTSGASGSENVPAGDADLSEEEPSVAQDVAAEQAVFPWLQSLVGAERLTLPEEATVSLPEGDLQSVAADTAAAEALSLPVSNSLLGGEPAQSQQTGQASLTQPHEASAEQLPAKVATETKTTRSLPQVRLPVSEARQPAAGFGAGQANEASPAAVDYPPSAASAPARYHGKVDVFRPTQMQSREAAVTAGPVPAMTEQGNTESQDAIATSRSRTTEPRLWQLVASRAQAAEQAGDRASAAISQATAARSVQLVAKAVAARAIAVSTGTEADVRVSSELRQSAAVAFAGETPVQFGAGASADAVATIVAELEQPEQVPESVPSSLEGVASEPVVGQKAESFSPIVGPLTMRDAEPLPTALPQNLAKAEAPRSALQPEAPGVGNPIETSLQLESKAAMDTVRTTSTRRAPSMESGQVEIKSKPGEPSGDSAETSITPSFTTPEIRSSASAVKTITLSADQLSQPSEQLQAALDAGIKQVKVSGAQQGEVTVKMRLYPEDLGEVHVNVRISEGAISAKFQAASQEAAQVIKESLANLRQALDGQGFSQVSLTAESFGSNLAQHSDRRSRRSPFRDERNQQQVGAIVAEGAETSTSRPSSGLSRLDYRF